MKQRQSMLNTEMCLRDKQDKGRWSNTYVTGIPKKDRENGLEAMFERWFPRIFPNWP